MLSKASSKMMSVKSAVERCKSTLCDAGKHVFRGATAAPYLEEVGLSTNILNDGAWINTEADRVARAVMKWALDNNASSFTHWWQPLGACQVRHGQTGQLHKSFLEFDNNGVPVFKFSGKDLIRGETDGSSFPNGGLRATHRAGGYLVIDPSSPIFLRADTVYIPACFASISGSSLDEKIPLLRATNALSTEGVRLLSHLGIKATKLQVNIGLEQEIFLVPRDAFVGREDLKLTGRTVIGKMPSRGQEMSDHYMAPPSEASPAIHCMREIQQEAFRLGIPLETRHREVAPNQYEFAPLYGSVTTQIDQNLMVMQIIDEVAAKYGLAALLQEKPFQGVNGSGKHNNWSIATDTGVNLLNIKQVTKETNSPLAFTVVMTAILKAVNDYGDLMRMSIASPGNDFRLGACEAPPSIISVYLGNDLTSFLDDFRKGKDSKYVPKVNMVDLGCPGIPPLEMPSEDRNRTSPFAFGGSRFEFRAVGSSQNVSMVNTVLATITAKVFKEFSERIELGQSPEDLARSVLLDDNGPWKVIFNGNGYSKESQDMMNEKGLWHIDDSTEAIKCITSQKNKRLFAEMNVLKEDEVDARYNVMLSSYIGTVEMEVKALISMINRDILPGVRKASQEGFCNSNDVSMIVEHLTNLESKLHFMESTHDLLTKAKLCRSLRLNTMTEVRHFLDGLEGRIPSDLWGLPSYDDLLFLDQR